MHVRVADPVEMRHDGHARVALHALDEPLAAARHDHVDVLLHLAQQVADGLAVLRRHELDGGLGQPVGFEPLDEAGVQRRVRAHGLGAAAQNRGVAALQAQRARIGRHVRAALVDDADDAERHAHALDLETVRALPARDDLPDRIGERGDGLDGGRDALDALVVEGEPIEQRRC